MKYVGPVDGHDIKAMESALRRARSFGGPVIVHAVTTKGFGYPPAETDQIDAWHATGVFDPDSGASTAAARDWTAAFSDELVRIGAERADVVAITAAMLHPTGLAAFAERYPERTFDVGIAEQHALTSAAGLAMGGLHPVVAVYSTFLNRAFDQLLMDVALHRQPVTVVLDRAGVTGTDGASHNGMWDMSILSVVPGLRLAAPAGRVDAARGAARGGRGHRRADRRPLPEGRPAGRHPGAGAARTGRRAAPRASGRTCCWSPSGRWCRCAWPSPSGPPTTASRSPSSTRAGCCRSSAELVDLAAGHRLVVTVEDGGRAGGVGHDADPGAAGPRVRRPGARRGPAAGVLRARQPRPGAGRRRADRAGHRPPDRRVDARSWASGPRTRWSRRWTARSSDRRDPGGAVAAGHRGEPARPRRGGDRRHPGVRAALRGRRARHHARGRRRRGVGDPARRARGDARRRRDRRASRTSRSPR